MLRQVLALVFLGTISASTGAAEIPDEKQTPKPNAIAVSELLKQTVQSPLGPSEARLLRAVAELVEKDQAAAPQPSAAASPPRKRLAIRLNNAAAADVLKDLERFLKTHPDRASLVAEPVSNTLLISAAPNAAKSLMGEIAKLDARPDMVAASIIIANFVVSGSEANKAESPGEKAPFMYGEGAAWLAWANKHGCLEVLSRPQIMTLVNQSAMIQIGTKAKVAPAPEAAPRATGLPRPSTDGLANVQPIEQPQVGLVFGLTPSISPQGMVVMELDFQQTRIVAQNAVGEPVLGKTTVQTTITAADGQTVVVGGLTQHCEDGPRQLIIAITPHVNPTR
jgi:type II secretory pathway component GspD/PulD (secretin)